MACVKQEAVRMACIKHSPVTRLLSLEGEGLGTLAKFLGYADIAFLIPGLPIR
jgi:hypothetical protein